MAITASGWLHARPDPVADALAWLVRPVYPQGLGAAQDGASDRRLRRPGELSTPASCPRAETQPHQLFEQVADLALLAPPTTTWPPRSHRATLTLADPAARLVRVVRAVR